MAVNKVICGEKNLIDLTTDTLSSASQLMEGVTAMSCAGELLTGVASANETSATYYYNAPYYYVNDGGIEARFAAHSMNSYQYRISFTGSGKNPECSYRYEDYSTSNLLSKLGFLNGSFLCFWKIGNIVSMVANLITTSSGTSWELIPEGFRPAVDTCTARLYFKLTADGLVEYTSSGGSLSDGKSYAFRACYATDLGDYDEDYDIN